MWVHVSRVVDEKLSSDSDIDPDLLLVDAERLMKPV